MRFLHNAGQNNKFNFDILSFLKQSVLDLTIVFKKAFIIQKFTKGEGVSKIRGLNLPRCMVQNIVHQIKNTIMKKISLIASALVVLCGAYIVFSSLKSKPKDKSFTAFVVDSKRLEKTSNSDSYSGEQIKFLKSMGLSNSETVKNNSVLSDANLSAFYMKKFGLKYMSNETVEAYCQKNDFIYGDLSNYIYQIPSQNVSQFKSNYQNVLSVDPSLKGYYFLRTSLDEGSKFLEKIEVSEISQDKLPRINGALNGAPQSSDLLPLLPERKKYYNDKYPTVKDIVVDHALGNVIKIIAPDGFFKKDGYEVVGNELRRKAIDPIIIMSVKDGWLILTEWYF
jgi:hypothetical protein